MRFLERDGVSLAYEISGRGTSPILLVHGWCDNHSHLAAMASYFSERYRVVNVDLRGHGQSDKPDSPYTIATFADDLAWMCAQLDIQKPIVIGHSLGGAIALEMAARHPDVPAAIIALEGTILFRSEVRESVGPFVAALRSPAWREAMHAFVEMGFTPTDDPDLRRRAHEEIKRLPQHVAASVAEQSLLWDAATAAHKCRVPVLYVDAGGALSDLDQFKALCPQLAVGKIIHVGHNQMVATPGQVNTMIDRFLAVELHHVGFELLTRETIRRGRAPRREIRLNTRLQTRERASLRVI
ncbi:MAG: alpha/beta hydrolase [Acidobacteriota bacterium]|nr:alpha/beta hydrolase [Acidobacteriota bacterium]